MPRKRPVVVDLKQTSPLSQQSRPQPTPHIAPIPTHSWVDFIDDTSIDFELDLEGEDVIHQDSNKQREHTPRFLSTDPLEFFLPIEEYQHLEFHNLTLSDNPVRFVPDTHREFPVLYQKPEAESPWWEGVGQWIDRITSGWSLAMSFRGITRSPVLLSFNRRQLFCKSTSSHLNFRTSPKRHPV